jgi:uncharacterized protein
MFLRRRALVSQRLRAGLASQLMPSRNLTTLYDIAFPLALNDPMMPVLGLASIQAALGAFDNIYHHELTERLPWRPSQSTEQFIHSVRGVLYAGVFASLAGITPHGGFAVGMGAILTTELGLTLWDFVNEDQTRKLPYTERIAHTLLTLNYGAFLACWIPILFQASSLPTEIVFQSYGAFTALNAICAVGVGAWSVRDWFASKRLNQFASETLPSLSLSKENQRFLITGGTGLLGSRLVNCLLSEGHEVTVLARNPTKAAEILRQAQSSKLTIVCSLKDFPHSSEEVYDVVINLAGESIAGGRWTDSRKTILRESRVVVTQELMSFLSKLSVPPHLILSGSAIGYYGVNDGTVNSLTEDSPPLETASFSQQLVREWEETVTGFRLFKEENKPRIVLLRTGVVLTRDGGALSQMLTPFEFGLGGPTGTGKQYFPWVHIDDWIRGVAHCINEETITGPINLTSPDQVTNSQFATVLGKTLHRPAMIPMPSFAMRLVLGKELADELILNGCGILPKKLLHTGFQFTYPDLPSALSAICHGKSPEKK